MQDLQVTIEVRFITLSDSFFERIGVHFDFTVAKNNVNAGSAGFTLTTNPTTGADVPVPAPAAGNGTSVAGLTWAPSSQNPI